MSFSAPWGLAGKSTAIKVLSSLLKKTSGRVGGAGFDIEHSSMDVLRVVEFTMPEVGLEDLVCHVVL